MPTWGVILTVAFSGIVALVSVINLFRSATKESINEIRNELKEDIGELKQEVLRINDRIDRHLEGHP
ncbi:MAG: hypothetical protein OXU36_13780 [Candidatus Poribacteria bacterium]|nr:hypothetical protein [Candidatus Poribacteria bacterium]